MTFLDRLGVRKSIRQLQVTLRVRAVFANVEGCRDAFALVINDLLVEIHRGSDFVDKGKLTLRTWLGWVEEGVIVQGDRLFDCYLLWVGGGDNFGNGREGLLAT